MTPSVLLDTHVLLRWRVQPQRLSREQIRILRQVTRRAEPLGISAITLLELAQMTGPRTTRFEFTSEDLFRGLEDESAVRILPLTIEIAREVPNLTSVLRDPADCVIVATARVHGLRLLTSDQRIIASNLVSTVE